MTTPGTTHLRPYQPGDHAQVMTLAPRLTEWVAPWRDPAAVRTAVHGWIQDSIDALGRPTQIHRVLPQSELARGRLGMVAHLARVAERGVPDAADETGRVIDAIQYCDPARPTMRAARSSSRRSMRSPSVSSRRSTMYFAPSRWHLIVSSKSGPSPHTLGLPWAEDGSRDDGAHGRQHGEDSCDGKCQRNQIQPDEAALLLLFVHDVQGIHQSFHARIGAPERQKQPDRKTKTQPCLAFGHRSSNLILDN